LRRNQRPHALFSLAGFEVTLIGRFWVTPEGWSQQAVFHSTRCDIPLANQISFLSRSDLYDSLMTIS